MQFERKFNLFFPYLLFDYPSREGFSELFEAAQEHADLIEIGIPFSDPVADGPVIQSANTQVLSRPFELESVFEFLAATKKRTKIALMSYANPIWNYGLTQFVDSCKKLNVDALIVPDIPFEESEPWRDVCNEYEIPLILFVSLLTGEQRLAKISKAAEGFIYLLSLTGVTGSKIHAEKAIQQQAARIRSHTDVPIALGFGIRSVSDALRYSESVNAFIVGSRMIEILSESNSTEDVLKFFQEFAEGLKINAIRETSK